MDNWFATIDDGDESSWASLTELSENGFTIIPGPVTDLIELSQAYDRIFAAADPKDVSHGSTTTRIHDLISRGSEFDPLYLYKPVLEACCHTLRRPFKLSSLLARTVRPHSPAQELHVDCARDEDGWPMLGFIFMLDEFRKDNGATRFVAGSHNHSNENKHPETVACGPAGSMILHNGAVWHGHSANGSEEPRRSIQGAFIRREAKPATTWSALNEATHARLSPLAKYLLEV